MITTNGESREVDEETSYITKRFLEIMRKNGRISRREDSSIYNRGNYLCDKFGKPVHFIKDYPLHKIECKEYFRKASDREKKKDQVLEKFN